MMNVTARQLGICPRTFVNMMKSHGLVRVHPYAGPVATPKAISEGFCKVRTKIPPIAFWTSKFLVTIFGDIFLSGTERSYTLSTLGQKQHVQKPLSTDEVKARLWSYLDHEGLPTEWVVEQGHATVVEGYELVSWDYAKLKGLLKPTK